MTINTIGILDEGATTSTINTLEEFFMFKWLKNVIKNYIAQREKEAMKKVPGYLGRDLTNIEYIQLSMMTFVSSVFMGGVVGSTGVEKLVRENRVVTISLSLNGETNYAIAA